MLTVLTASPNYVPLAELTDVTDVHLTSLITGVKWCVHRFFLSPLLVVWLAAVCHCLLSTSLCFGLQAQDWCSACSGH